MSIYLIEILPVFLLWQLRKYKVKSIKNTSNGKVFYLCCCFLIFGMTMALNPANKDRQIGFQPTRKLGRKYKEDDLTYNRNLLGHGDIEKVVSEEKIRQLSRSIMDVLWFSLWNKSE